MSPARSLGTIEGVDPIGRGKEVILVEAAGLHSLADALDENFAHACRTIFDTRRQLVITGMGKSGHIAKKVAATFSATGTPSMYLHPSEAGHGDLGTLAAGDVLLAFSNSGSTAELKPILNYARKLRIPIIGVASRARSLLLDNADVPLLLPSLAEACSVNIAPTTSTTMQLALGDALAMTVMDMRGVSSSHLGKLHPGGLIGIRLAPVAEFMHGTEHLPLVARDAAMAEAISVMTRGCFGLVGVTDAEGMLVGVITDGDLRRHFAVLGEATAKQVMTTTPKVIGPHMLVVDALQFLNANQITAAFVVSPAGVSGQAPIGIIHIHDLLRLGLA